MKRNQKKCLIICGGKSDEHDISIYTASSFCKCLEQRKDISVGVLYISQKGEMYRADSNKLANLSQTYDKNLKLDGLEKCELKFFESNVALVTHSQTYLYPLAYPIILGKTGEDGYIYSFFRSRGCKVIGPKAHISQALYNKSSTKQVCENLGIPYLPATHEINVKYFGHQDIITTKLNFPMVVKPLRGGSSNGVSVCNNQDSLKISIQRAKEYDSEILFEPFVEGYELSCYVWHGCLGEIYTSGVVKIQTPNSIYTFEDKYIEFGNVTSILLEESNNFGMQVRSLTRKLYSKCDGNGLWRCDFFLTEDGRLLLNEVNTVPAFMNISGKYCMPGSEKRPLGSILTSMITGLATEKSNA